MTEKISFIILTWNSEKTIDMCLKGIARKCREEAINYEVLIVDNGSHDRTVEIINKNSEKMPISLVCLPKNRGTTCTRNLALRECKGDVICILDSDTAFLEGNLTQLVTTLLIDESIGIIAPKLVESSGKIQTSVKKFPTVIGKISRIPQIIFKRKLKEYDVYNDFPFSEITEVDCAISACWFFRRELLNEVGYLDERIFYAPEDVDYCLRVRKQGKKMVYYPELTVLHQTQQITHKNFLSRIAISHLWGLIYYFLKHKYIKTPDVKR